jgi:regulator of protease activity HflC (stomatin/prohibitin superfamily)
MKQISLALVLLITMLLISGCAEVGPQEGGVRTTYLGFSKGLGAKEWFKQGIKVNPLEPGLYMHIPHLTEVVKYPVKEQQYHMFKETEMTRDDVSFKTKDGQKAWIDVTVRYRLLFDKLSVLHREYGGTYIESVLRPTVRSLVNNKLGEFSAEQIYDGKTRQTVAKDIGELMNVGYQGQRGTREMGLEIVDVLFRRFEFTEEYQAAIELKRIASEQNLAAVELAKKKEAEARGEKLAVIQKAEGEAEQVRLEADAGLYAKLKEAEGIEAVGKAEAMAQSALADALGGGGEVVRLEFARHLAPSFQVWGIPTGDKTSSVMDLSGLFGSMFPKGSAQADHIPAVK